MSSAPVRVSAVLAADRQLLEQVVHDAGRLLLRATLLAVAARNDGRLELTTARLERLSRTLREAVEDGRGAVRSWEAER